MSAGKGRARGYTWAPFTEGNTAAERSGAYSPRRTGPLAAEFLAWYLAAAHIPDRVKGMECRADLEKLALARAQAKLLADEVGGMDVDEMTTARRAGGTPPFALCAEAEMRAARLEEKLRIDGMSLLAEQADADAEARLEALAARGAEIAARREAQDAGPGSAPRSP